MNGINNLNSIKVQNYIEKVFISAGLNEHEASITAEHLVGANLRGVETHGLQRAPIYVKRIKEGGIKKNINIEVQRETPVSALIDGKGGMGPFIGKRALEIGIKKAKDNGIGIVGVHNTNHNGMLAYYTEKAVEHDLIAFVTTTGETIMAPHGGKEKNFGVNPISFSFPSGNETPFILDMSTGVVARGKIIMALKNDQSIPLGWAVDKNGEQTTDPKAALDNGLILPLGGPKGYGLAFMADIFSNVLTGANWGSHVNPLYDKPEIPQGNGQFFFIMRPDLLMEINEFKKRMDRAIYEIRTADKAEGFDRIYIPGEKEAEVRKERLSSGIPVPKNLIQELEQVGESVGVHEKLISTEYW